MSSVIISDPETASVDDEPRDDEPRDDTCSEDIDNSDTSYDIDTCDYNIIPRILMEQVLEEAWYYNDTYSRKRYQGEMDENDENDEKDEMDEMDDEYEKYGKYEECDDYEEYLKAEIKRCNMW